MSILSGEDESGIGMNADLTSEMRDVRMRTSSLPVEQGLAGNFSQSPFIERHQGARVCGLVGRV